MTIAVSGSISSDPKRKQAAPIRVNKTYMVAASKLGALGSTKANTAETMKATHPERLINVTTYDRLLGLHAQ